MIARNLMNYFSPTFTLFFVLMGTTCLLAGACGESTNQAIPTDVSESDEAVAPQASLSFESGHDHDHGHGNDVPGSTQEDISPEEAYNRVLVYTVGASHVFQRTNAMLVDAEIERREIAGLPLVALEVSDEEVDVEIELIIEEGLKKDPNLDFWKQVEAMGYTKASFVEEKRRHLKLIRLFFPPEPDDWPMELLKEVFGNEGEGNLYDAWIAGMPKDLLSKKERGESYRLDNMTLQMFLLPHVIRWLYSQVEIKEPFDGLPEGVCLSVGGKQVLTSEMLQIINPLLTPIARERASRWVELQVKVGAALADEGLLLSPSEAQAMIDEDKKEYEASPISYEQIALQVMGFPTMEMFKQHYLLRRSFGKSLPNPLPLEELEGHLELRRQFLGDGKANAEVILFSAIDLSTGSFPDDADAFDVQASRAAEAEAKLRNGVSWGEVLDEYSDYPEKVATSMPGSPQPRKGRLGNQSRNPLRQFLGENDYTDFLQGYSIGRAILFDADIDEIYGPVRGPYGYYMYKVKDRVNPTKEFDLKNDKNQVYLVSDDLLSQRFLAYIEKVMSVSK